MSTAGGALGGITSMLSTLGDIRGNMTSALNFEDGGQDVFPFEVPPELAASDFYTMAEGSGAQPDSATPSPMAIGDMASKLKPKIDLPKEIPFAEPFKDQGMVDLVKDKVVDKAKDMASDAVNDVSDALDIY